MTVRTAAAFRRLLHLFRMDDQHIGHRIWREPELRLGNISTPCIVHPNDKRWPPFGAHYTADFEFAAGLAGLYPQVKWVYKVIGCCERDQYGPVPVATGVAPDAHSHLGR